MPRPGGRARLAEPAATNAPSQRQPTEIDKTTPEVQRQIAEAAKTQGVLDAIAVLTKRRASGGGGVSGGGSGGDSGGGGSPPFIRGCQINPGRAELEALKRAVGWTLGGYNTRPSTADRQQKHQDRLAVLMEYYQPPTDEGSTDALVVGMYDYIMHTVFGLPVAPCPPSVHVPAFLTPEGKTVQPSWVQVDWGQFDSMPAPTPLATVAGAAGAPAGNGRGSGAGAGGASVGAFKVGVRVSVAEENAAGASIAHKRKVGTVVEICADGDIAVRYADGFEEEVAPDFDIQLVQTEGVADLSTPTPTPPPTLPSRASSHDGLLRLAPVFARNLYSYQLDAPAGVPADAHPFQLQVHHWLLWYFHRPTDPYPAPADSEIDANVRAAVAKTVTAAGFKDADFVWYHNPGVSVPDVFHVQVFWRILHP